MPKLLWILLGLPLLAGGGALAPALTAASAQRVESSLELNGRPLVVSRTEEARLGEVRSVLRGGSRGAQDRALAAARSVVNTPDARHVLALYELEIGRQRQDDALRAAGLDVLIVSRDSPPERMPGYLAERGQIAFRTGDLATAATLWTRIVELQPNDPQALMNLAQVRHAQHDALGAVELLRRAVAARGNTADPVPEVWYRQWVSIAYNGQLAEEGSAAAQALVAAYPTSENWRLALVAYRQLAPPQDSAEIDLLRLMRAAGVLTRPDEYQRFAQLLNRAGLGQEARAVLQEGISRGIVNGAQSPTPEILREIDRAIQRGGDRRSTPGSAPSGTPAAPAPSQADLLLGQGRFAEAASAYQNALRLGSTDAVALNVRLGTALALAERRTEAETAFRTAAAGGASGAAQRWYADLARFWLAWLARAEGSQAAAVTR